jgi:hypothetical protein
LPWPLSTRTPASKPKPARHENYRDALETVYAKYPDDETKLIYGLSIPA